MLVIRISLILISLVTFMGIIQVQCENCAIEGEIMVPPSFLSRNNYNFFVFGALEVLVYSKDGSVLKETTRPNPNGYFVVPVYDEGDYLVRVGHTGVSFKDGVEESAVSVKVKDGGCVEIVDFVVTGFRIEGMIADKNFNGDLNEIGPDDIVVTLFNGQNEEKVTKTVQGKFFFNEVFPGSYVIKTGVEGSKEIDVEVGMEGKVLEDKIVIEGYNLKGRVDNGDMQLDVYLYKSGSSEGKYLRKTKTKSGGFKFSIIATGTYFVKVGMDDSLYGLAEDKIDVEVLHSDVQLDRNFEFVKYPFYGKVINPLNNETMEFVNVKIHSGGDKKDQTVITDENGKFQLNKLQKNTEYTLEAVKQGYKFEKVSVFFGTNELELEHVVQATHFRVCGNLLNSTDEIRTIIFVSKDASKKEITIKSKNNGKFCNYLPLLDFREFEVKVKKLRKSQIYVPTKVDLEEYTKAVSEIEIHPLVFSVSGEISFLPFVEFLDAAKVELVLKKGKKYIKTVPVLVKGDGTFIIDDLKMGKYSLKVNSPFCWENAEYLFEINEENRNTPKFVQTGVSIQVHSKVIGDLKINGVDFAIEKEKSSICLANIEKKHVVEGIVVESPCFEFRQSVFKPFDSYKLELRDPKKILIQGKIEIPEKDVNKFENDVSVLVSGDGKDEIIFPEIVKKEQGIVLFSYFYWAEIQDKVATVLELYPKSDTYLFSLEHLTTTIKRKKEYKCSKVLQTLTTTVGVKVHGEVFDNLGNPVAGTRISFSNNGKAELLFQTNDQGKFVSSPLRDIDYEIVAQKDGYSIVLDEEKSTSKSKIFVAEELSTLTIQIYDGKEGKSPLENVFVSVTSDTRFKKILSTDSEGILKLSDLVDNTYYIRVHMKEYKFGEYQTSITFSETNPKHQNVEIRGERYLFSALGRVTTLNSGASSGLTVVALDNTNSVVESAETDDSGHFRIRGLAPSNQYSIEVRTGGKRSKLTPPHWQIEMEEEDEVELDFVDNSLDFESFENSVSSIFGRITFVDFSSKLHFSYFDKLKLELFDDEDEQITNAVVQNTEINTEKGEKAFNYYFSLFVGSPRIGAKYSLKVVVNSDQFHVFEILENRYNSLKIDFSESEGDVETPDFRLHESLRTLVGAFIVALLFVLFIVLVK